MTNQNQNPLFSDQVTKLLLEWYHQNARQLPWRETSDPYAIWISEVMLQQTQVDTVIPYYLRFLTKYPTVQALADAPESEILKNWEGLGYYRRARLLHHGAKEVVQKYNCQFPDNHQTILKIPGIGPYMAGAISSIAFNLPTPAIDGNVLRVVSRQLAWDEPIDSARSNQSIFEWVAQKFPTVHRGDFTQSLMELGALICTPRNPKCQICPISHSCQGKAAPDKFPVKKATKKIPVERRLVLIINWQGKRLLLKRPETGLMAGFWEYPNLLINIRGDEINQACEWTKQELGIALNFEFIHNTIHVYTHLRWELEIYKTEWLFKKPPHTPENGQWFTAEQERALSRLAFMRKLKL